LFFLLGVLACGFVVVLFAPAVLRRAVRLTRRRLEATMPLTKTEIAAEKDGVRAELAMAARRLEMEIQTLREKLVGQSVEVTRGREAARQADALRGEADKARGDAEARIGTLQAELGQREAQLQHLSQSMAEAEKTIEARAGEIEKLGQMYDEASFSSSNRQIELVARESEIEQAREDIASLRAKHKEAAGRQQQAEAEVRTAREALRAEKKKTADLDKKLERLLATLADREDKLDRRERELARLRAKNGGGATPGGGASTKAGDDLMREEMQDLAAKVVGLVVKLEGPNSPAAQALATYAASSSSTGTVSLADRVKALQARPK
jgi:chromosome segregation ATPase